MMHDIKNTFLTTVLIIVTVISGYIVISNYTATPKPDRVISEKLEIKPEGFSEGNKNSQLSIYVFFDYSCSFCKQSSDILSKLQKEFNYKFKLIHVPVPLGREFSASYKVTAKSYCFYQQTNNLFAHKYFLKRHNNLNRALLDKLFSLSGISTKNNSFQQCLNQQDYKKAIDKNKRIAGNLGIISVPALLINDSIYFGTFPENKFKSLIKKHLRQ